MSTAKDKEFLSTNLALLLKAGIPIGEAIESLTESIRSTAMKKRLKIVGKAVDEGLPLSEALKKSKLATPQTLTMVQLGEESGNLAKNLELAAEQEQKQRVFRSKLRSAMLYPAFVLGLTLIVGLSIAWFLLPRLAETFAQLGADLPPVSQAMINVGIFLRDNGVWAVPGVIVAILLLVSAFTSISFLRNMIRRLVLHIPGIGRLAHELEISRFGYMLGTLIETGLPITKSLILLKNASTSPAYQKMYQHLADSLDKGLSFQESFRSYKHTAKLLPSNTQQVIVAGERSGSLPDTLRLIGETYEQRVDTTTKNLEVLVEPVLLVGVWLGVMLVAVAVILPIYSLIGGLNA